VLDQHWYVADVIGPDREIVESSDLQAADARLADAGADRHAGRHDAVAISGALGDDGHLGAGVEHEIDRRAVGYAAAHDHLVVFEPEGDGMHGGGIRRIHFEGYAPAEGVEEADLRSRDGQFFSLRVPPVTRDALLQRGARVIEPAEALLAERERV